MKPVSSGDKLTTFLPRTERYAIKAKSLATHYVKVDDFAI